MVDDNVGNRRTSYDSKWWLTENSNILFPCICFHFLHILVLFPLFVTILHKTFSSVSRTFASPMEACLLNSMVRGKLSSPCCLSGRKCRDCRVLFLLVFVDVFLNPLSPESDQHLIAPYNFTLNQTLRS